MYEGRLILVFMVLGSGAMAYAILAIWLRRVVLEVPLRSIGRAKPGLASFFGRATISKVLRTPISNQPCCWWQCTIETTAAESTAYFRDIFSSRNFFVLQDESGQLPIYPDGAELELPRHAKKEFGDMSETLSARGMPIRRPHNPLVRVRTIEQFIPVNGEIFVFGEVQRRAASDDAGALVIIAPAYHPFLLSSSKPSVWAKTLMRRSSYTLVGGLFLVSVATCWMVVLGYSAPLVLWAAVCGAFAGVGIAMIGHQYRSQGEPPTPLSMVIVGITAGLVVMTGIYFGMKSPAFSSDIEGNLLRLSALYAVPGVILGFLLVYGVNRLWGSDRP